MLNLISIMRKNGVEDMHDTKSLFKMLLKQRTLQQQNLKMLEYL